MYQKYKTIRINSAIPKLRPQLDNLAWITNQIHRKGFLFYAKNTKLPSKNKYSKSNKRSFFNKRSSQRRSP